MYRYLGQQVSVPSRGGIFNWHDGAQTNRGQDMRRRPNTARHHFLLLSMLLDNVTDMMACRYHFQYRLICRIDVPSGVAAAAAAAWRLAPDPWAGSGLKLPNKMRHYSTHWRFPGPRHGKGLTGRNMCDIGYAMKKHALCGLARRRNRTGDVTMSGKFTAAIKLTVAAAVLGGGLSLVGAGEAKADLAWSWSFTPTTGTTYTGTLITAGATSSSVDPFFTGANGPVSGYLAKSGSANSGAITLDTALTLGSPAYYDNLVQTTGPNTGLLDVDGLLFKDTSNNLYNFYDNSGTYSEDVYTFAGDTWTLSTTYTGAFLLTQTGTVPEPASMALLATGLFGLVAYRRRKSV